MIALIFSCQINKRGRLAPAAGSAPPRLRTPPRRSAGRAGNHPTRRGSAGRALQSPGRGATEAPLPVPELQTQLPPPDTPAPALPRPPPLREAPARAGSTRLPFPAHPRDTPSALVNLGGSVGTGGHPSPTLHRDPGKREAAEEAERIERRRRGSPSRPGAARGRVRGSRQTTPTAKAVLSGGGKKGKQGATNFRLLVLYNPGLAEWRRVEL